MLKELVFTVLIMVGMITISILYISGLFYILISRKEKIWSILYVLMGLLVFTLLIVCI